MLRAYLPAMLALLLCAAGCDSTIWGRAGTVLQPAPGAPAGIAQLPAPPQGAVGAVRAASDYLFQETDVFAMEGGSWTGEELALSDPGQPGLSYAILGSLAAGQQVDGVRLDGTCSGLWLGVGDYGRGTWHWLAGPLAAPGDFTFPSLDVLNDFGEMFLALACPPGASCNVSITLLVTEPGNTVALGPVLAGQQLKPLLGVNAGPYHAGEVENPDLVAEYAALGVNYVRTHDFYGPLDLAEMYPDRSADPGLEGSYNFTESDLRWQAILDCGAQPYLRLGDSYSNPTPPADEAERDNLALAAVEILRHYRSGQWSDFETDFDYVEIWNEPDGIFWPDHTRQEFFYFYDAMARAVKNAFPEIKVGGPGFTPAGYLAVPNGQQYVSEFLAYVENNVVPLDFISWHMYSNIPVDYSNAALWYRLQLEDHGFNAAESHITEWNTSDKDLPLGDVLDLRTGPRGAAVLSAAWIALQGVPSGVPVDVAAFYRGNDTEMGLPEFFGLHYANGTRKKIASAFALWRQLCAYPELVLAEAAKPGGGASPLWVIAGTVGAAQALLLVNPIATPETYSVSFNDGSYPEQHSLLVYEVSAAGDGTVAISSDGVVESMPGYSVQLITIDAVP